MRVKNHTSESVSSTTSLNDDVFLFQYVNCYFYNKHQQMHFFDFKPIRDKLPYHIQILFCTDPTRDA